MILLLTAGGKPINKFGAIEATQLATLSYFKE
jgi:hypothetical protein